METLSLKFGDAVEAREDIRYGDATIPKGTLGRYLMTNKVGLFTGAVLVRWGSSYGKRYCAMYQVKRYEKQEPPVCDAIKAGAPVRAGLQVWTDARELHLCTKLPDGSWLEVWNDSSITLIPPDKTWKECLTLRPSRHASDWKP